MAENSIAKGKEELWAATAKVHQNASTGPAVTPATEDDSKAIPSDEKVVDATAPSGPVLRKPGRGGYRNLSVEEATEKFWVLAKQIEDASEEPDSGGSDDEAGDPIGDVVDAHGPDELDVDLSVDSSSSSLIDSVPGSVSAEGTPIQEDAEQVVAAPADHPNADVRGAAVVPDLTDAVSQEPSSSSLATAVSPVTEWVLDE